MMQPTRRAFLTEATQPEHNNRLWRINSSGVATLAPFVPHCRRAAPAQGPENDRIAVVRFASTGVQPDGKPDAPALIELETPMRHSLKHARVTPSPQSSRTREVPRAEKPDEWRHTNVGRLMNNAVRRFETRVFELLAAAGHT